MPSLQEEASDFRAQHEAPIITEQDVNDLVAKIPSINKYDFVEAYLIDYRRCSAIIDCEISKLAGGDEKEVIRIGLAIFASRTLKDAVNGLGDNPPIDSELKELVISSQDKTPTLQEFLLSVAKTTCSGGMFDFKNGDIRSAMSCMALSNEIIGMFKGDKGANEMVESIKKRDQENASSIRHALSRALKAEVIQDYADNYAPRLKGLGIREASKIKNQAAEEMACKYSLEYRTVRNDYIDQYHRENTLT